MIEHGYSDLEYRAESGEVKGVVVRYGDTATVDSPRGSYLERIMPGAFDLKRDVYFTVQHDRRRILALTGGGGLELRDSPKQLDLTASIPGTTDGRDARELLRRRTLRGLSVEMKIPPGGDSLDISSRIRSIHRADLWGVSLVDNPAYADSEAILTRFDELDGMEYRAKSVTAAYRYNQTETVSDTGRQRKRRITPGAFSNSIDDPAQEITLQLGRDPGKAIASKLAGTLLLRDRDSGLEIEVRNPPDTTAMRDFEAQVSAGMTASVVPQVREVDGGFVDVPEPGNPAVDIREYTALKLYALALTIREPKGAESKVEVRGRRWHSLKVY